MEYVSGPSPDQLSLFIQTGRLLADIVSRYDLLSPTTRFLDIGCGCGRLARHLLDTPLASYTGFDRHAGMVAWCRENIEPLRDNFRFHHFSVKSAYDHWDLEFGERDGAAFEFPFDDGSFDSAFLGSVFTHMKIEETRNYLGQIHRTLSSKGKVVLSVFQSEGEPFVRDTLNFYYSEKSYHDLFVEMGFEREFLFNIGAAGYEHHYYRLTKAAV
jgi:SAM-dependent methyltransferase